MESPAARLRAAIEADRVAEASAIVAEYPETINFRDDTGATPLHWAAQTQSLPLVKLLLDAGADPKCRNALGLGFTPLDVAYWHGEYRMGAYTDVCKQIAALISQAEGTP